MKKNWIAGLAALFLVAALFGIARIFPSTGYPIINSTGYLITSSILLAVCCIGILFLLRKLFPITFNRK